MTQTIVIAPVRKSLRVAASRAHAFEVFTAGLGRWWPRTHSIGSAPVRTMILEAGVGGRWYEVGEDGSQVVVGKVLAWDPPKRFVVSWDINSRWKPDATVGSEVEVNFVADGPNATRVELEHRKFERMGAQAGESMRSDVDRGWPGILDLFAKEAEA
jgi:uncharacterized protein YndB with AHSA1/START domain